MATAKILIVEDESIIALDIKNSLEKAGYDVVDTAACAEEALDRAAHLEPDLVLMDIRLQGDIDGVETANQIRQHFHLPVIYLTAHADDNTLQRAKISEPFGYILKPFEDRELITTIEIALSRHKAESAMREALEREREFNELKSRFISVVSHEFRNPLNTILFSSELLQRYNDRITEDKRDTYLQRIQVSVKRMNQLLTDVLTVGEAEAGKLQYNPVPLDLVKFCQDIVDEARLDLETQCSITFTTGGYEPQAAPGWDVPPLPRLDERLLRHILTNLLSNAIKYSPQGGNVEFHLTCKEGEAIFQIQDEGIGIPADDQARLFNSFHRGSNVKTIPGTGLGLSIVKQCVDLHGGTITVASQVDRGTTFTVTLPLLPR